MRDLLPMVFAIGSFVFASTVWAVPGVEERSAGSGGSAAAPSPDLSIMVFEQFQQFQAQIETLTGRVEQLEHALQQAREQDRARYVDLDGRIGKLEKSAEEAVRKPVQEAPVAAAGDGAATTLPVDVPERADDEQAMFDRGLVLVREKKYDEAISAFEQQLKQYPRGELTPTAMYWLGEMWRVASKPDLPKAGRYFYRVYNEYPKNSRASAAMYLHGLIICQEDVAKGRVILNKVLLQHPASKDAELADNALKNQCK